MGRLPKRLCPDCFRNGQIGETCPECGAQTICIGTRARVPRKSASRRAWMKFLEDVVKIKWFYPDKEWGMKWKRK